MKKADMIRRLAIFLLTIVILFASQTVGAEGILPPWTELEGIGMPSISEALQRYPDSETKNEDGSITYFYQRISQSEYEAFSIYLEQQGAELGEYRVEHGLLTSEIRANDASFGFCYNVQNYEAKVTFPSGTRDQWIKAAKKHFIAARSLLKEGKTDGAVAEILKIPQYRNYPPVKDLLQSNMDIASAVAIHEERTVPYRTLGNIVTLGSYEQDKDLGNGKEPVEWIVLDYDPKENKALLISRYCLETINYDWNQDSNTTWETCSLRNWLNNGFMKDAFSAEEQTAILVTEMDNSPSQGFGEWPARAENNTQDQVFCLSCAEAKKYFNIFYYDMENMKPRASATRYAMTNGTMSNDKDKTADGEKAVGWWLRSPGHEPLWAANVCHDGSLRDAEYGWGCAVRPALWLDLNADIF